MEFEPHRLIQKYKTKTETNASVLRKAIYYSNKAMPWLSLVCALLITAIVVAFSIMIEGSKVTLFVIYGIFIAFEFVILSFLYFITPAMYCRKNKKNPTQSDAYLFDDSYILILCEAQKINGFETSVTNRITMYFSTIISAKKDEHAYYFVFKNEKWKKTCIAIDIDELSEDSKKFLDEQVERKQKKKKTK